MRTDRRPVCVLLAWLVASAPALAQQPLHESARRAAEQAAVTAQAGGSNRARVVGGAILAAAGGAAIVLGMTTFTTADATSGNAPEGAYDACVAQRANPVYRGNDCDVLKGPQKGLVIGGTVAAASGVLLMLLGQPRSSIDIGPGGFTIRRTLTF
jgi:hypothetical protein